MPRTNGIFSLLAGTKGISLTTILSGRYNAFLDDLVADLNAARPVIAGGTGGTTADAAAKNLGLISAKDLAGVNTVGGTANAITIATERVYTAYANTLLLTFKGANANSGAVTIDLDALGVKPVYKVTSSGKVALTTGDIIAGGVYQLGYDTTANSGNGGFILINPTPIARSDLETLRRRAYWLAVSM